MAGEIYHSYDSSYTLYAVIYDATDSYKVYNFTTAAFEAWSDGNIGDYDLPMTASGDMHYADFPDLDEGLYIVHVRVQAGGSPNVDDIPVAQGRLYWAETAGDDGGSGELEVEDIVTASSSIVNEFYPPDPIEPSRIII